MVHAFNPSPREQYKMGEDISYSLILRFLEAGLPFRTEVEVRASGWLFCFSDLQIESEFLSLDFY